MKKPKVVKVDQWALVRELQAERDDLRVKLGHAQERLRVAEVDNTCLCREVRELKDAVAHVAGGWASCVAAHKYRHARSNHDAGGSSICSEGRLT